QFLKKIENVVVLRLGSWPTIRKVLRLEKFTEAVPRQLDLLPVTVVVQVAFQVHARGLGLLGIRRSGALALAPPRLGVDPLKNQGLAVQEALNPDANTFFAHAILL